MPGVPYLSSFGLGMEGADAATRSGQDITLRDQSIQERNMGLEEMTRERTKAAQIRQAGARGSFEDMATAAEANGDPELALKYRKAQQSLEDEGMKSLVHGALVNSTPGKRPDLATEFNKFGKKKIDPNSLELDESGNLKFMPVGGGQPMQANVGVLAERLGMVKPFEKELPANARYIRGSPLTGKITTDITNEVGKFAGTRNGVIFNTRTGEPSYTPPDDSWTLGEIQNGPNKVPVSFSKKTGQAVIIGPGGNAEKVAMHTDPTGRTLVTIGNQVFEVTPGSPAQPGKTHVFGPNEPGQPAQPTRLTPISPAQAPPMEGAKQAPDGNWYVPNPNKPGSYMQVVTGEGGSPSAAPKSAQKPVPKAATDNLDARDRQAQGTGIVPAKAEEDALPEVGEAPAQMSPAARHQSRVAAVQAEQKKKAEAGKQRAAAAPKEKAAETFRVIASSQRMTTEDIPLIKEGMDSGLLTAAEMLKGRRMLEALEPKRAGMKSGGKVARYGL